MPHRGPLHARIAWEAYRVPTAALRFFNVFGPRQDPNSPYSGVITIFAERIRRGRPPILHGDGQQTRDFIYVSDVTRHLEAAVASLKADPRAFMSNVCTGHAITIEQLARRMAALMGRPDLPIEFGPARAADIRFSRGDPGLAERALEVRAETTLDEGLSALLL